MELIWPFRTKSESQYRRIDEGWDLQTDVGANVLAILPGTVHFAHDPGSDGGHFGATYPWVALDKPYNGHVGYYLGHTCPAVPEGTHVNQGDVVAHTGNPGNGGAPAGWLEIGWWRNGPEGKGGAWTQAGQDMHDHLINAPVHQAGGFLVALTDQEQETLKLNVQQAHDAIARMEGVLNNVLGAVADIQSRVGNVVQPDVEAIKKHDGA